MKNILMLKNLYLILIIIIIIHQIELIKKKMYLILNKTINILDSSTLSKEIYFHPKVTFKRLNLLEPNNQIKIVILKQQNQ